MRIDPGSEAFVARFSAGCWVHFITSPARSRWKSGRDATLFLFGFLGLPLQQRPGLAQEDFGRVGARPLNLEEQRKLSLRGGKVWTVSDDHPTDEMYKRR